MIAQNGNKFTTNKLKFSTSQTKNSNFCFRLNGLRLNVTWQEQVWKTSRKLYGSLLYGLVSLKRLKCPPLDKQPYYDYGWLIILQMGMIRAKTKAGRQQARMKNTKFDRSFLLSGWVWSPKNTSIKVWCYYSLLGFVKKQKIEFLIRGTSLSGWRALKTIRALPSLFELW